MTAVYRNGFRTEDKLLNLGEIQLEVKGHITVLKIEP